MSDHSPSYEELARQVSGLREEVRRLSDETQGLKNRNDILLKNEKKYRMLLSSMSDIIFLLDGKDRFVEVHNPQDSWLILPEGRFIGEKLTSVMPESIKLHYNEAAYELRKTGTTQFFEYNYDFNDETRFFRAKLDLHLDGESIVATIHDITETVVMQQKLEKSEERLSFVIEGTDVGLWDWQVQTGETVFNERWAEIIGYTLEELEPVDVNTWVQFCHPGDLERSNDMLEKNFSGELDYYSCECRMKHKNGSWVWVHDRGKVVEWSGDGRPVRMAGTHTDITERKKAEDKLLENQKFLDDILTSIQDGISVLDTDLNIIYTNPVMEKWYRANLPLKGRRCYECYHDKDAPCDPCPSLRCIDSGNTERDIVPGLPGGPVEWIELFSYPLKDNAGRIVGVIEFVRDISERMKAEEGKRKSEAKFRSIVESTPLGMLMYRLEDDDRLVLIETNPAADRILKIDSRKLIGKTIEEAFPPLAGTEVPRMYRLAASTGETWTTDSIEYQDDRIKGAYQVIAFQISPGTMVALFHDITERKKTENELALYREQLEELVEKRTRELEKAQEDLVKSERLAVIGSFAGSIAHEIRNPLGAIAGSVYFIDKKLGGESEKLSSHIRIIKNQILRTTETIDSILNLADSKRMSKSPVDLSELIEEVLDASGAGRLKNIETAVRTPDAPAVANVDRGQVRISFQNIVKNALQAMPDGGRLSISVERIPGPDNGEWLECSFSDTGCGIESGTLERIFEPLYSTKTYGFGFGLSIVKMIADKHGGEVLAESRPGEGSTFKLRFRPISSRSQKDE